MSLADAAITLIVVVEVSCGHRFVGPTGRSLMEVLQDGGLAA